MTTRPAPTTRLTLALATAGAYSAFPAAFYHLVQDATGSRWTTAVLFAAHGVAQVAAMSALARGPLAVRVARRVAAVGTGRVVAALLLLDAAGALLLVLAPEPSGFALLLLGRVVTGLALGALAPLATAGLTGHPRGAELATVAILGAVGVGSVLAGLLAAAGWSRSAVLAVGLVALPAAAWLVRGVVVGETPAVASPDVPSAPAGPAVVPGAAVLAFVANGVLGLFCSTLPGVVAGLAQGAAVVAGATTGLVMISAGAARLALGRLPARPVRLVAVLAAALGLVVEVAALAAGHLAGALLGAALLGAAAGIGFDTALRLAAPHGLPALARVQRGGQLGLVLPVLAYPLLAPAVAG
jgi:MFS family permease